VEGGRCGEESGGFDYGRWRGGERGGFWWWVLKEGGVSGFWRVSQLQLGEKSLVVRIRSLSRADMVSDLEDNFCRELSRRWSRAVTGVEDASSEVESIASYSGELSFPVIRNSRRFNRHSRRIRVRSATSSIFGGSIIFWYYCDVFGEIGIFSGA
jgi:hypothetical protein